MKKNVLKEIIRFAITVLSAVGAVLGVQSCTIYSGNRVPDYQTKAVAKVSDINATASQNSPQELIITYKD